MLLYKKFFKNSKMSKMLLRIGFIKLLIFCLFSMVIQCNTKVKVYLWWLIKLVYKRVFTEGDIFIVNYL